jgi:hypothetical protein
VVSHLNLVVSANPTRDATVLAIQTLLLYDPHGISRIARSRMFELRSMHVAECLPLTQRNRLNALHTRNQSSLSIPYVQSSVFEDWAS